MDIDGITIEVQKKKVKNMTLRICPPHGIVKVSAPLRASDRSISLFILSHLDWIKRHQSTYQNAPSMESHHFDKAERQLLKDRVHALLPYWEEKMGVRVEHFQIRLMRSRWGSCTPHKRKICLNLALLRYPAECLEYVLVHELVHLLEPSHNARFKALMDRFMPPWRVYKALLD